VTGYDAVAARFTADTGPHEHEERLPYGHIGPLRLVTDRPHEMTVLHDEGLYRHLRFKSPDASWHWFDLITWPGCLTVRGDFGDGYTFARVPDMFEFFRDSSWKRGINPTYWAEKLDGGRAPAMTYSPEKFAQTVWEHVRAYGREHRGMAKAVQAHFFDRHGEWDTSREDEAREALEEFRLGGSFTGECVCGSVRNLTSDEFTDAEADGHLWQIMHSGAGHVAVATTVPAFRFVDTWEWSFADFDQRFLWACHAIVWGIARYDAAKSPAAPAPAVATAALVGAVA
jgi:hypothetical protein